MSAWLLGLSIIVPAPVLAASGVESSVDSGQGTDERAARIERLEAIIQQQRDALSEERAARRAMSGKLEEVRSDLEHARERQQSLEERVVSEGNDDSKKSDTR